MFSTDIIYEVVTFAVGDTKSGTKMGKLQLKDPANGEALNCILWEEALNRMDSKLFRCGNQLKIGLDEDERNQAFTELSEFIEKIKDEKLKSFVQDIYTKHKDLIMIMPAAKLMHHNYVGGLMVHILECLKYAEVNMQAFFQRVNHDEVFAACLLHDIGKIFEYKVNTESGLIDYDENFRKEWVSHSQYGFTICMSAGFKRVAKMIAAHHARTDWGAIVDLNEKDLEPFVYLIHHIDDLSAKFGKTNVNML